MPARSMEIASIDVLTFRAAVASSRSKHVNGQPATAPLIATHQYLISRTRTGTLIAAIEPLSA